MDNTELVNFKFAILKLSVCNFLENCAECNRFKQIRISWARFKIKWVTFKWHMSSKQSNRFGIRDKFHCHLL